MSTPRDDTPDVTSGTDEVTYETEGERIRSDEVYEPGDLTTGTDAAGYETLVQTEGERIGADRLPGTERDPVLEAEAATTEGHKIRADDLPEPELDEPADVTTDGEK